MNSRTKARGFLAAGLLIATIAVAQMTITTSIKDTLSAVTGKGSHVFTEAETGPNRTAELTSALIQYTTNAAVGSTVIVFLASGNVTNLVDEFTMATQNKTWDPPARIFVNVGDHLIVTNSWTNLPGTSRYWLQ